MTRFNSYFASGFAGCRLLAEAFDHCRNRQVKIYQVPGEFDFVGISDGHETWIAPAVASVFSVNVRQILDDIKAGKVPQPGPLLRRRGAPVATNPPPLLRKRPSGPPGPLGSPTGRIIDPQEERQQVLNTALAQQQTLLRRR